MTDAARPADLKGDRAAGYGAAVERVVAPARRRRRLAEVGEGVRSPGPDGAIGTQRHIEVRASGDRDHVVEDAVTAGPDHFDRLGAAADRRVVGVRLALLRPGICSGAELSVDVDAPCPDRAVRAQREVVVARPCDGGDAAQLSRAGRAHDGNGQLAADVAGAGRLARGGQAVIGAAESSVAELAPDVVAPGEDVAAPGECLARHIGRDDGLDAGEPARAAGTLDGDWRRAVLLVAGAQLALVVAAPGPDDSCSGQRQAAIRPGRHRGDRPAQPGNEARHRRVGVVAQPELSGSVVAPGEGRASRDRRMNGGMRCRERTSRLRSRRQPDQSGRRRGENGAEFCGHAAPEFPRSRIQLICH